MKTLLVIVSALFSYAAIADAAPSYSQFYLVNGKKVSAEEAIIAGLKGAEAFQCKAVQSMVSKSGTSIGIKAIKKPAKLSPQANAN